MHLTFVLLPEPTPLDGQRISRAYAELFDGDPLAVELGEVLTLRARNGEALAMLAEGAIPAEEVAGAAQHAAYPGAEIEHVAHVIVTSPTTPDDAPPTQTLLQHARIVAAVAVAHGARAVYDGEAPATLPVDIYAEFVQDELPISLWSGLSVAKEEDGRASLLTLGLGRFGVPNLMVGTSADGLDEAFDFLWNIASYVVRRGEAIADGETLGRTAEEKLTVSHIPSPIDDEATVMRIDLP